MKYPHPGRPIFLTVALLAFAQVVACDEGSSSSGTQDGGGASDGSMTWFGGAQGSGANGTGGTGGRVQRFDDAGNPIPEDDAGVQPDAPVGAGGDNGGGGSAGNVVGAGGTGTAGNSGSAGTNGTAGSGAGAGTNAAGTSGTAGSSGVCTPGSTQCTDCIDNDGDNLRDANDPECFSPLDNDEKTFATGIPGDNRDDLNSCKQDCFFDGNSGGGGGDCQWNLHCDPLRTAGACTFEENARCPTEQSAGCLQNCQRITPNGCDCFGCCAVTGAPTAIRLGETCTSKDFGDPTKCTPCTQTTTCINTCERCELCIGKDSIPADCFPPAGGAGGSSGQGGAGGNSGTGGTGGNAGQGGSGGEGGMSGTGGDGQGGASGSGGQGGSTIPPPQCPAGLISCGPGGLVAAEQCPAGAYCITGCCIQFIE